MMCGKRTRFGEACRLPDGHEGRHSVWIIDFDPKANMVVERDCCGTVKSTPVTAKVKLSELSLCERVVTIEDADELAALIEIAQAALAWRRTDRSDHYAKNEALRRLDEALTKVDP